MGFVASGDRIWPVPPDWSAGVQEQLAWATDIVWSSGTAVSQHRGLRIGPRRSFTFEVLANGQDRRVADMLLAGYSGPWLLPVWPDVQWLTAPLAAGVTEVPCTTNGFDFDFKVFRRTVNYGDLVRRRSSGSGAGLPEFSNSRNARRRSLA